MLDGHEICVLPDDSHLLKNIRNALFRYNFFLHPDTVTKYSLPSNVVTLAAVIAVAKFQEQHDMKLCPRLTDDCFLSAKAHFKKMKVVPAQNIFHMDTAAGIRFLVKEYPDRYPKMFLSTAWFIQQVAEWRNICSSSHSS